MDSGPLSPEGQLNSPFHEDGEPSEPMSVEGQSNSPLPTEEKEASPKSLDDDRYSPHPSHEDSLSLEGQSNSPLPGTEEPLSPEGQSNSPLPGTEELLSPEGQSNSSLPEKEEFGQAASPDIEADRTVDIDMGDNDENVAETDDMCYRSEQPASGCTSPILETQDDNASYKSAIENEDNLQVTSDANYSMTNGHLASGYDPTRDRINDGPCSPDNNTSALSPSDIKCLDSLQCPESPESPDQRLDASNTDSPPKSPQTPVSPNCQAPESPTCQDMDEDPHLQRIGSVDEQLAGSDGELHEPVSDSEDVGHKNDTGHVEVDASSERLPSRQHKHSKSHSRHSGRSKHKHRDRKHSHASGNVDRPMAYSLEPSHSDSDGEYDPTIGELEESRRRVQLDYDGMFEGDVDRSMVGRDMDISYSKSSITDEHGELDYDEEELMEEPSGRPNDLDTSHGNQPDVDELEAGELVGFAYDL